MELLSLPPLRPARERRGIGFGSFGLARFLGRTGIDYSVVPGAVVWPDVSAFDDAKTGSNARFGPRGNGRRQAKSLSELVRFGTGSPARRLCVAESGNPLGTLLRRSAGARCLQGAGRWRGPGYVHLARAPPDFGTSFAPDNGEVAPAGGHGPGQLPSATKQRGQLAAGAPPPRQIRRSARLQRTPARVPERVARRAARGWVCQPGLAPPCSLELAPPVGHFFLPLAA